MSTGQHDPTPSASTEPPAVAPPPTSGQHDTDAVVPTVADDSPEDLASIVDLATIVETLTGLNKIAEFLNALLRKANEPSLAAEPEPVVTLDPLLLPADSEPVQVGGAIADPTVPDSTLTQS